MGVCDSKSMVVASDVLTEELGDDCLVEICKAKSSGSSLLSLGSLGIATYFYNFYFKVYYLVVLLH